MFGYSPKCTTWELSLEFGRNDDGRRLSWWFVEMANSKPTLTIEETRCEVKHTIVHYLRVPQMHHNRAQLQYRPGGVHSVVLSKHRRDRVQSGSALSTHSWSLALPELSFVMRHALLECGCDRRTIVSSACSDLTMSIRACIAPGINIVDSSLARMTVDWYERPLGLHLHIISVYNLVYRRIEAANSTTEQQPLANTSDNKNNQQRQCNFSKPERIHQLIEWLHTWAKTCRAQYCW